MASQPSRTEASRDDLRRQGDEGDTTYGERHADEDNRFGDGSAGGIDDNRHHWDQEEPGARDAGRQALEGEEKREVPDRGTTQREIQDRPPQVGRPPLGRPDGLENGGERNQGDRPDDVLGGGEADDVEVGLALRQPLHDQGRDGPGHRADEGEPQPECEIGSSAVAPELGRDDHHDPRKAGHEPNCHRSCDRLAEEQPSEEDDEERRRVHEHCRVSPTRPGGSLRDAPEREGNSDDAGETGPRGESADREPRAEQQRRRDEGQGGRNRAESGDHDRWGVRRGDLDRPVLGAPEEDGRAEAEVGSRAGHAPGARSSMIRR